MKKVMILAVVAALLGISAPNALSQVPGSQQPSSTQQDDDQRDQQSTSPSTQPGQTGTSGSEGTSGSAMEYTEEVNIADLPATITRTLNEKYPGYKTEKAFRAKDGSYKIKVSKGDEKQTLFLDARGESVKMLKDMHNKEKESKQTY